MSVQTASQVEAKLREKYKEKGKNESSIEIGTIKIIGVKDKKREKEE